VKLTTHLQLASRLRMRGTIPPLTRTSSLHVAYLSTGHAFMAWYLVKLREDFTFTFTKYGLHCIEKCFK
jgi:hypothetical protein